MEVLDKSEKKIEAPAANQTKSAPPTRKDLQSWDLPLAYDEVNKAANPELRKQLDRVTDILTSDEFMRKDGNRHNVNQLHGMNLRDGIGKAVTTSLQEPNNADGKTSFARTIRLAENSLGNDHYVIEEMRKLQKQVEAHNDLNRVVENAATKRQEARPLATPAPAERAQTQPPANTGYYENRHIPSERRVPVPEKTWPETMKTADFHSDTLATASSAVKQTRNQDLTQQMQKVSEMLLAKEFVKQYNMPHEQHQLHGDKLRNGVGDAVLRSLGDPKGKREDMPSGKDTFAETIKHAERYVGKDHPVIKEMNILQRKVETHNLTVAAHKLNANAESVYDLKDKGIRGAEFESALDKVVKTKDPKTLMAGKGVVDFVSTMSSMPEEKQKNNFMNNLGLHMKDAINGVKGSAERFNEFVSGLKENGVEEFKRNVNKISEGIAKFSEKPLQTAPEVDSERRAGRLAALIERFTRKPEQERSVAPVTPKRDNDHQR